MIDPTSVVWREVVDYCQRRREQLRDALELPHCDREDALLLRGELKALRQLINLPQKLHEEIQMTKVAQDERTGVLKYYD